LSEELMLLQLLSSYYISKPHCRLWTWRII